MSPLQQHYHYCQDYSNFVYDSWFVFLQMCSLYQRAGILLYVYELCMYVYYVVHYFFYLCH